MLPTASEMRWPMVPVEHILHGFRLFCQTSVMFCKFLILGGQGDGFFQVEVSSIPQITDLSLQYLLFSGQRLQFSTILLLEVIEL